MLRNLIAAIFLLALALPAVAMPLPAKAVNEAAMQDCHGMPMDHGRSDNGDNHTQHRGCIGCIASYAAMPVLMAAVPLSFIIQSTPDHKLNGTVPRPSLPPPRA